MKYLELNIDRAEFNDIFINQQLWQRNAAESLVNILTGLSLQARKYKSDIVNGVVKRNSHSHDAILVSGGRGTGKTVFLKNAELIWRERKNNCEDLNSIIHFTSVIDPTLLQSHDSFTNVIVAHIYNETLMYLNESKELHSNSLDGKKRQFYDSLRKLAEAIDRPGDKSLYSGLDKIIKYSSGIKIELLFHDFVEAAIEIMKCDAIVLPIDDIDMALNQAYPVLEEIRRLLSCPYIIPLVSGDTNLYKSLVKISLADNLGNLSLHDALDIFNNKQNKDSEFGRILELTSEAYLTKVLPHQYRINLLQVDEILNELVIRYDSSIKESILYKDYRLWINKIFFGKINGEERSIDFAEPNSAREVVQLIKLLHPHKISMALDFTNDDKFILEAFKAWAEAKQHGANYCLARSAQQINSSTFLSLGDVFSFNLKKQSETNIGWAKYNFLDEQLLIVKDYFSVNSLNNNKLLNKSLPHNILKSMPPLEMHTNAVSITKKNESSEQTKKIIFNIYTDRTYYNSQETLQRKIFFSRAYDILGTSLIMAVKKDRSNNSEWRSVFERIFSSRPFYSIFSINPTKTIDDYNEVESESMESEVELDTLKENVDQFITDIFSWNEMYAENINNFIGNSSQLVSLLSAVFNKTFSQLNILRYRYNVNVDDSLIDAILRFFYISTNAFGFFIKENGYIATNVAINTSITRLRDRDSFIKESSTYRDNVAWALESESDAAKFLQAIIDHPIFEKIIDLDFKSCANYTSSKITNSSGAPFTQNKNIIDKAGKKRMQSLSPYIGRGKLAATASSLLKKISAGQVDNDVLHEMFHKMKADGVSNKLTSYIPVHVNIYNVLSKLL